jgi:D-alanyl-D-alanine carboxypeptidase
MVDDATQLGSPAPGSLVGRMMGPGGNPRRSWVPWDLSRPDDADAGVINFFLNSGISAAALGPPGESFHYSDTGFMLLGLLVEHVGGKPYHVQLREQLFTPLGLNDTYLAYHDDPPGLGPARQPEADCWAAGMPCLSGGANLSFDWAGGGIVSSARALNMFLRALLDGRLFLKRETLWAMLDWQVPPGLARPRTGVGFGIFRTESPCGDLVGHSGAWGAKMVHCRELDVFFAGTTNQSAGNPNWHWPFLEAARDALRG